MVQLGAGGEEVGLTEEGKNIAYECLTCNPRQCEIEELYAITLKEGDPHCIILWNMQNALLKF